MWGKLQTLELYVQEFAAENVLYSMVPAAKTWVRTAAPRALELFWHQFGSSLGLPSGRQGVRARTDSALRPPHRLPLV